MSFFVTLAHTTQKTLDFLMRLPQLLLACLHFGLALFDLLRHLLEAIDDFIHLKILQANFAHQLSDQEFLFCDLIAQGIALLPVAAVRKLLGQLHELVVLCVDFFDQSENTTPLHFFGIGSFFLFVFLGDLRDANLFLDEFFSQANHFSKSDGRLHDHPGNKRLTFFDALGDLHFPLAGQQGNLTHFTQIHAYGVTGPAQGSGFVFRFFIFPGIAAFLVAISLRLGQGYLSAPNRPLRYPFRQTGS